MATRPRSKPTTPQQNATRSLVSPGSSVSPDARIRAGDVEDFAERQAMRRHIGRMQGGTPMLVKEDGESSLKSCVFSVSEDLQTLRWQENGSTEIIEMPLDLIEEVGAAGPEGPQGLGHAALALKLRGYREKELICATPEDFATWCEGLGFLMGGATSDNRQTQGTPSRTATRPAKTPTSAGKSSAVKELQEQLIQEEVAAERLRREARELLEAGERKEATIQKLLKDLQGNPDQGGYNKTGASSRESDGHLRERQVAVLRGKNDNLRESLQERQEIIDEILGLLSSCFNGSPPPAGSKPHIALSQASQKQPAQAVASRQAQDLAPRSPAAPLSSPAAKAKTTSKAQPKSNAKSAADAGPKHRSESALAALQDLSQEMALLRQKEQVVQKLALEMHAEATGDDDEPPTRANGGPAQEVHADPEPDPEENVEPNPRSAVGTRPIKNSRAEKAMQELGKEMAILQAKQLEVQELATKFHEEAAARAANGHVVHDDDDEDDGFPLR